MADTGLLKTFQNELSKSYVVYDVGGRMTESYECREETEHGEPCLKTEYVYASPTSSNIVKRRETVAEWDSSWDVT